MPCGTDGGARTRGRSVLPALGLLALGVALLAPDASADPFPEGSIAIGYPWRGRLAGAERLHETSRITFVSSEYERGGNVWGSDELLAMIRAAAVTVTRAHGGTRLAVGELSTTTGGRIPQHRSHQNGLDADLGFYFYDARGGRLRPSRFVRVGPTGWGRAPEGVAYFDEAANWDLLAALLRNEHGRVHQVFVARHLERRLLEYAERRYVSRSLLQEAREVMEEPRGHPHDNHFHVRILCPPDDVPHCKDATTEERTRTVERRVGRPVPVRPPRRTGAGGPIRLE